MATLNTISDEIIGALDRPFDAMFKERVKSIFRNEAATIVRQAINKDGLNDQFKTRFNVDVSVIDYTDVGRINCGILRSTNKLAQPIRYNTDEPFSFVGNNIGTVSYIYTKAAEVPYADLTEVYNNKPIRYVYENGYIHLLNITPICGIITAISNYSEVADSQLVTSIAHGLTTGDSVSIYYNGVLRANYTVTVVTVDTYYVMDEVEFPADRWTINTNNIHLSIEGVYPVGDMFSSTNEAELNSKLFTDDTELPLPNDLIQAIKLKLIGGELSLIDDTDRIKAQHIDN